MDHVRAIAVLFVVCSAFFPQPANANEAELKLKQRFSQAMAIMTKQPEDAAIIMQGLASDGYGRAMDRLGFFYLKGIGVTEDLKLSIAYYNQAVAAGNAKSLVSLGKAYMILGDAERAISAFTRGIDAGVPKAGVTLAWAHATGRLGALSKPAIGILELTERAEEGDCDAQVLLLAAQIAHPSKRFVHDGFLDRLHERVLNGDSKAAEGLLRYYRIFNHERGTVEVRAALLKTPGLRAKTSVEEGLYLASELEPQRFWIKSEELVRTAPNDVFARALVVTAKINKNAYVRIVQKELHALGYRVGRLSPYLHKAQIRAINRFCHDQEISVDCRFGPLKSTTAKALAAKLADVRNPND